MSGQWQDLVMERVSDTTADAHRVQVEAFRRMGGEGRWAATFRLIELTRNTAMAGIRSRHPDYDEERARLAFARIVLGADLVQRVWPGHELVDP